MPSRFFVELPADEYGNTAMKFAVVEAQVEQVDGREILMPIAPKHFVDGWPTGWYRDSFGGWAEVEGPARLLGPEAHKRLVSSLSEEVKAGATATIVKLRTGQLHERSIVALITMMLQQLMQSDPPGFYEVVQIARDANRPPNAAVEKRLSRHGLLQHGVMHQAVREIVLASIEGDMGNLQLVNPLAS